MDNTVIIYTGDQGFMLGEHDYLDKRWMYESPCACLSLSDTQDVKAGQRFDTIIENVDAPTMLDFAGPTFPRPFRGGLLKLF